MPPTNASSAQIKRQFTALGCPAPSKGSKKKSCPRYRCNHCPNWEGAASSPSRLQEHLNGCKEYQLYLRNQQAASSQPPPPSLEATQKTLQETGITAISSADRKIFNLAASRAIIVDGRSFSLFESPAMLEFFTALRPGWKPVTKYLVDSQLDEVRRMFLEEVMVGIRAAEDLSIIFDASDNVSSHRIVNISVKLPDDGPAFYWKTFDTGDKQHTAEDWVELIVPELLTITDGNLSKINSICTDTEATMRATHDLLQQRPDLQHVNFSLCDSHGQQLLIKDTLTLEIFLELMEDTAKLLNFFSRSKLQHSRLRSCQSAKWNGTVRALIRGCVYIALSYHKRISLIFFLLVSSPDGARSSIASNPFSVPAIPSGTGPSSPTYKRKPRRGTAQCYCLKLSASSDLALFRRSCRWRWR